MPVFVIVAKDAEDSLSESIRDTIPEASRYRLADNAWLVDYKGTTKALAEGLRIRSGALGASAIVFPISNWSGHFASDAWEWLKLHATRGDI